jgi:hypothetical protein
MDQPTEIKIKNYLKIAVTSSNESFIANSAEILEKLNYLPADAELMNEMFSAALNIWRSIPPKTKKFERDNLKVILHYVEIMVALSVANQALKNEWQLINLIKLDTTGRGQYSGPVVGVDRKSLLINYSNNKVVEIPFSALPAGQRKPMLRDTVQIKYPQGQRELTINKRSEEISLLPTASTTICSKPETIAEAEEDQGNFGLLTGNSKPCSEIKGFFDFDEKT